MTVVPNYHADIYPPLFMYNVALVSGDLDVRQEDGTWLPHTVAFTDVEVVLQGLDEGAAAEFHALSPSRFV